MADYDSLLNESPPKSPKQGYRPIRVCTSYAMTLGKWLFECPHCFSLTRDVHKHDLYHFRTKTLIYLREN